MGATLNCLCSCFTLEQRAKNEGKLDGFGRQFTLLFPVVFVGKRRRRRRMGHHDSRRRRRQQIMGSTHREKTINKRADFFPSAAATLYCSWRTMPWHILLVMGRAMPWHIVAGHRKKWQKKWAYTSSTSLSVCLWFHLLPRWEVGTRLSCLQLFTASLFLVLFARFSNAFFPSFLLPADLSGCSFIRDRGDLLHTRHLNLIARWGRVWIQTWDPHALARHATNVPSRAPSIMIFECFKNIGKLFNDLIFLLFRLYLDPLNEEDHN